MKTAITSPHDIGMRNLPPTFNSGGFEFEIRERDGAVALMAKHKPGSKQLSYEVVIVQIRPGERIFGRDLPPRESLPRSEDWGLHGWSFVSLDRAMERFQMILSRRATACGPRGDQQVVVEVLS